MAQKIKVVNYYDVAVDDKDEPRKIFTIEGACRKCNLEGGIIALGFKPNKKDPSQSIVKTKCLCCFAKDIYFAKDVILDSNDPGPLTTPS